MLKDKNNTRILIKSNENKEELIAKVLSYSKISQKEYYPRLWAEILDPINGESFSSWIIRTALANLEKTSSLIGNIRYYPSTTDLDLELIPELLEYFSMNTNIPEDKLKSMGLFDLKQEVDDIIKRHKSTSLFIRELYFTGWRKRTENGLRICPLCLKEDKVPYFRKMWRLAYIPICLKHNCFLENNCPECQSPIAPYEHKWNSSLVKCQNCGFDLTDTQPLFIKKLDLILQAFKFIISNNDVKDIYKILTLSWFIANHSSFSDDIFEAHPFSKSKPILNIEKNNLQNPNKKSYFLNLQATFLLIGTAIRLFQNKKSLENYLHKHYTSNKLFWTDKPYFCPEENCNFSETSYARMEIHVRRHNNERLFLCEKCKTTFITKWDLETHLKLHNQHHPFKCSEPNCGQEFRYEKQYINHLRIGHNIKPYDCSVCNKRFDRKYNLKMHIRIHTGEKPYICEKCKKKFSQKSELNIHIRTHTGEKPYKCEICGKRFTQSHSLTEHVRTHTDERPYVCLECGKRFKRKHHLNNHIRIHTGEKPFICKQCGKKFSDRSCLKNHMIVHTEERPFNCEICGRSYKYKSSLSKHKKIKH